LENFLEAPRHWNEELFDSAAAVSILDSEDLSAHTKGSEPQSDLFKSFQSPFIGKSVTEIFSTFSDLVKPLEKIPSFWAMHSFIILDDQTAADKTTCLLVSDMSGEMQTRRAEFEVFLAHLVPVEMGFLDLAQCAVGGSEVLTEEMMEEELRVWEIVRAELVERNKRRRREEEADA
jgi:hypothetical protein